MNRVDFYILQEQNPPEKFACAIATKLTRQGLAVHIHTDNRETAVGLDEYLWTYKDISFLPHKLVDDRELPDTPVSIGWNGSTHNTDGVLINLGMNIPDFAGSFARIIEIVAAYDPPRAQARDRYRQYRDRGYELHNHDIEPKDANI